MSGPKTSGYTLTAEQRRILRELARMQRLLDAARLKVERSLKDVSGIVSEIDTMLYKSNDSLSEQSQQTIKLRNEAMLLVNEAKGMGDTSDVGALNAQSEKLSEMTTKLLTIKSDYVRQLEALKKAINKKFAECVSDSAGLSFKHITRKADNKELEEQKRLLAVIEEAIDGIEKVHLPKEYLIQINTLMQKLSEMDNLEFIQNFYAMSVKPVIKSCKEYENFFKYNYAEYEDLLATYKVLAKEAQQEVEEIPFSNTAIASLKQKIEVLEDIAYCAKEQEYISTCIEEAMQEMGYDVIGSREVTKKSGRKFRNELYLFEEGTAVNVTYTGNGQISMELGGLDTEDRVPTNSESIALTDSMYSFCDAYAELERKLRKKGIVTKHISILPPEEQYAQIINTEDYEMTEDVEKFDVKKDRKQIHGAAALHKELKN